MLTLNDDKNLNLKDKNQNQNQILKNCTGIDLAMNRRNWIALCIVERSDANLELFKFQLGQRCGWCS